MLYPSTYLCVQFLIDTIRPQEPVMPFIVISDDLDELIRASMMLLMLLINVLWYRTKCSSEDLHLKIYSAVGGYQLLT